MPRPFCRPSFFFAAWGQYHYLEAKSAAATWVLTSQWDIEIVRGPEQIGPPSRQRRFHPYIDAARAGAAAARIVDAQGRLLIKPVEGTGDAWVGMVKALMDGRKKCF